MDGGRSPRSEPSVDGDRRDSLDVPGLDLGPHSSGSPKRYPGSEDTCDQDSSPIVRTTIASHACFHAQGYAFRSNGSRRSRSKTVEGATRIGIRISVEFPRSSQVGTPRMDAGAEGEESPGACSG